jgi:hypothetical protein
MHKVVVFHISLRLPATSFQHPVWFLVLGILSLFNKVTPVQIEQGLLYNFSSGGLLEAGSW